MQKAQNYVYNLDYLSKDTLSKTCSCKQAATVGMEYM